MKSSLLALFFFGISANAAPLAFEVPKATGNTPASLLEKNVKSDARVKHYSFSVTVPKGWSFTAVGYAAPPANTADQSDQMITMAPSATIDKSPVSIGVRTVRKGVIPSLDKLFSQLIVQDRGDKTKQVRMLTWHGKRWVMETYRSKDKKTQVWGLLTLVNNNEYRVIAVAPYAQRAKYEPIFMDTFAKIDMP